MIFKYVADEDKKIIQDMLGNPKKMFDMAKKNPELFEEYEDKIYQLARQGEAMMQQYAAKK